MKRIMHSATLLKKCAKELYKKNPNLLFWRVLKFIIVFWRSFCRNQRTAALCRSFKWTLKRVLKTPYLKCNPNAKVEIHTLTSHRHLFMYMTAIKSFLRYFNEIAVIVHDDGSLTKKDNVLLKHHIRGLK